MLTEIWRSVTFTRPMHINGYWHISLADVNVYQGTGLGDSSGGRSCPYSGVPPTVVMAFFREPVLRMVGWSDQEMTHLIVSCSLRVDYGALCFADLFNLLIVKFSFF